MLNSYSPALMQSASTPTSTASVATAYTQSGGTVTKAGESYAGDATDESAVKVTDSGTLTLTDSTIVTSGNTSSNDNSSFYGLNAAVLAESGSTITLLDSTITTSGSGANGAFATGAGSSVTLSNVKITATGDGGHGVMATNTGVVMLTNVDMNTAGAHSGAIATDRGSGTITETGGIVVTSGVGSPGIYSTGNITVSGATISATDSEAAVIEGANTITLTDTALTPSKEDLWGVMIYQSFSGDAEGNQGTFTMTGGSLSNTAKTGPLLYVTNSTGTFALKNVEVTVASGTLVEAGVNQWGKTGSNGGNVILTADSQTLAGDMVADEASTITATLQNKSSLEGAINLDNSAKSIILTLDASSTWTVTADSHLTCISDADGISGTGIANIIGNGHTVTYDASDCADLGGKTYSLSGSGTLQSAS